jgi:hypothetical protein
MKQNIAWAVMCLAFIILALILVTLYRGGTINSISDVIQAFLTGCLVLVTAYYAWATAMMSRSSEQSNKEMKMQSEATIKLASETQEQRLDYCRPLLIPTEGWNGVANISTLMVYRDPERLLRLKNIGSGPALNITTRLEKRSENSVTVKEISESVTATEPTAAGGEELVRHWYHDSKAGEIEDNDWIVINYCDMFNRRFRTEAKYVKVKDSNIWVNLKVERVQ